MLKLYKMFFVEMTWFYPHRVIVKSHMPITDEVKKYFVHDNQGRIYRGGRTGPNPHQKEKNKIKK